MRVGAATAHAVVVDGQDELLVVGDRLALPGQAQDALAHRLGDVDGVLDTGDGVVVVVPHRLALVVSLGVAALAGRSRVDDGALLDLLEVLRGVLQVVLELFTGEQEACQCVVEDVQAGDVLDLDIALREGSGA